MTWKRLLGLLCALGGVALLILSSYIERQVAEGEQKIESAQKKLDTGKQLFNIRPETQQFGDTLASPIQKKINEGTVTAAHYAKVARQSRLAGLGLLAIATLLLLFGGRRTTS